MTSSWSQLDSGENKKKRGGGVLGVPPLRTGGWQYLLKIMGLRDDLNKVVTVRKWGDINTFLKSWG